MFASGSKTKNIIVRTSMTHRQMPQSTTTTTTTTLSQRSARRVSSSGGETTRIIGGGGHSLSPQMRSKYTERKATPQVNGQTTTRTRREIQSSSTNTSASCTNTAAMHGDGRKTMRGIPSNTAARANARQMQKAAVAKLTEGSTKKSAEDIEHISCVEIGIQTNESEILDHDLIVGDIKLLPATASISAEIERQRNEARKKQLLKVQRKFEVHSEKQEEHLTDLKEFLEKSVVTRRARKPKLTVELDRKLINSMDEILNKGVPKTESITDIKERIKKKEQELLTLFDTVENLKICK